ncbi:Sec-independent protein translocase subunit TatA [Piscicoccus intestinalis]|uniref:Sec-independent protein translocase subunit TatA n=1 Tax=Piscicoccus intestinalis TaxID=746033 RepID=UPI0008391B72|nr:Sec-independent protein translocase subunit TatA [Piscicoccus intestinalis]
MGVRGLFEGWHLVVLIILIILLFGWKRLPDAARSLGRSARIFKAEVDEMKTDKPSAASRDTVRGEASPRTSAGERPEQPEAASQATSERDRVGGDYVRDEQAPQYPESQQRDTTEYEAPAASASGDPQAPHHRQ